MATKDAKCDAPGLHLSVMAVERLRALLAAANEAAEWLRGSDCDAMPRSGGIVSAAHGDVLSEAAAQLSAQTGVHP
jgi:hypothetical protein